MNCFVEGRELRNNIPLSINILMARTVEYNLAINFIKNMIFNENIEDKSTFKII